MSVNDSKESFLTPTSLYSLKDISQVWLTQPDSSFFLLLLLLIFIKWKLSCDVTDAQPVLCPLSLAGSRDRSDWHQTSWCCEGSECSARFTTARCHHNQQFGWISLWGGGKRNPFAISQALENPVFRARCAGPRSDCSRLTALSMPCCVLFFLISHMFTAMARQHQQPDSWSPLPSMEQ